MLTVGRKGPTKPWQGRAAASGGMSEQQERGAALSSMAAAGGQVKLKFLNLKGQTSILSRPDPVALQVLAGRTEGGLDWMRKQHVWSVRYETHPPDRIGEKPGNVQPR